MRLIDANALEKRMAQRLKELEAKNGPYDHYTNGFDDAITYVDEAPTIDAVPVVHARWIYGITLGHEWRKCSKCLVSQGIFGCFTYCPNCGAKMDGGATDV